MQITVVGFIDFVDSRIDEYQIVVAVDTPSITISDLTEGRSCARRLFAPTSLFFVAADAHSQSLCKFFRVANVNSFLSLNQIQITSLSNFEQPSFAWWFASVSSSECVF